MNAQPWQPPRAELEVHAPSGSVIPLGHLMKIVIPGGSGQVGRMLVRAFEKDQHEIVILTRKRDADPGAANVCGKYGGTRNQTARGPQNWMARMW